MRRLQPGGGEKGKMEGNGGRERGVGSSRWMLFDRAPYTNSDSIAQWSARWLALIAFNDPSAWTLVNVGFSQYVSLVSCCCSELVSRLLVSASQDGKLIIWDSYTTNKVSVLIINDRMCNMYTNSIKIHTSYCTRSYCCQVSLILPFCFWIGEVVCLNWYQLSRCSF